MADNFPFLARQIKGPIAHSFGLGIDHVYEADAEFIDWLSHFSIDNLEGKWLDQLGVILGLPRPYITQKLIENDFEFDIIDHLLDGTLHGFSSTDNREQGGLLEDLHVQKPIIEVNDTLYKRYLKAASLLKRTHSLQNIANVLKIFIESTRFAITFNNAEGWVNDVNIILSPTSDQYEDALKKAFKKIFTTSPEIIVNTSLYFDTTYTVPNINKIIEEVTGSTTGYTVTYTLDEIERKAIFTITLSSSLASYEQKIKRALDVYFAGTTDIVINIVVS